MVVALADFGKVAHLYNSKSLFKRPSLAHCLAEDAFLRKSDSRFICYLLILSRMKDNIVINTPFSAPHTFVSS